MIRSNAFYSYLDSGIGTNFILWLLQLVHLQRRCFSFVKKGVFFFFKAFSGLGLFCLLKKIPPTSSKMILNINKRRKKTHIITATINHLSNTIPFLYDFLTRTRTRTRKKRRRRLSVRKKKKKKEKKERTTTTTTRRQSGGRNDACLSSFSVFFGLCRGMKLLLYV